MTPPTPGGVLGGITVVLYGMIGLLGAKIWIENKVNFANPVNLIPIAAGLIAGIGGVTMGFGPTFSLSGIALGSIVAIVGFHLARILAPAALREPLGAAPPPSESEPQFKAESETRHVMDKTPS